MSERPLVSILIPCYNHENFLDDCLKSLIHQTYENIELLICDDCSPDNSFAKIKSYEKELSARFRNLFIMQNEKNLGVTSNVNRMLSLAKGKYIKTLASDDALSVDAIEKMVAFFEENPTLDVVVSNGIKVLEDEHYPNFTSMGKIYEASPNFDPDGFFERVGRCNEISAPAAMVKKSVYEEFGFYDETIKIEDFEFWLRVLKDGKTKFGFLNCDLVYYRINANSMSSMKSNEKLESRRRLFFNSERETLYKYKEYFEKTAFAEILLQRTFNERCFAIEMGLNSFLAEIEEIWRKSPLWKDIPLKKKISFKLSYLRSTAKKFLKKII